MTEEDRQLELARMSEHYLDLESMEITEDLLDLCGATIDARALSLLRRRLQEEEAQILLLQARGYVRMCEKAKQLVRSLRPLIALLEPGACENKR